MSTDDIEYFRQRAVAERALARSADKANVAAIHDELARGYEALVRHKELRSKIWIVTTSPDQPSASA
jgi:hypothetical protein